MNKGLLYGVSIALAAGLALGGCGKKVVRHTDGTAEIKTGDVDVKAATNDSASVPLPSNMPSYAAVYPGANVKAVIVSHSAGDPTIISYATKASLDDVIAFHKKNSEAASLAAGQEMAVGNGRMFTAQSSDGAKTLVITASSSDGEQTVQLAYK